MLRNYVTTQLRKSKQEYLKSIVCQSRKQPKKLWTEIGKMLGQCGRPSIRLLRTEKGDITGCCDVARAINTFFIERIEHMAACIDDEAGQPIQDEQTIMVPQFNFTPVNESTVIDLLRNLDVRKATGCDKIQARALKLTAAAIARPLCCLFNLSLKTTQIPLEWKSANITPLLKHGDETQMENYRPISVLPVVAKVMERIVFNQLYCFLQEHSLLTQHQSGFRPNHCTQDVLIGTVDEWLKGVDNNHIVAALFLDLSKAFDMIDHKLLLRKMRLEFGVMGEAGDWFQAYLSGRRQRVCIGKVNSPWLIPRFGVPQGSILGPLMFYSIRE